MLDAFLRSSFFVSVPLLPWMSRKTLSQESEFQNWLLLNDREEEKKNFNNAKNGKQHAHKKNWVMKDCLSVVIICRSKMDEWQFGDKIEKENKGFCGAKQYLCLLAICHTISRLKIISCHYIFFSYISNDFFASAVDSIT